jgi:23S rRNA pseudouridine955/2504/2580 synthase
MSGVQQFTITAADGDQRLDRWFKRKFPHLTHGRLEKLLRTGQVRIDGKRAKAADRLMAGMIVRVPPLGDAAEPRPDDLPGGPKPITAKDAEALRKAVLFKDADVIVINKPAGLAVQGGTGLDKNIDAMLEACNSMPPNGRASSTASTATRRVASSLRATRRQRGSSPKPSARRPRAKFIGPSPSAPRR